MLCFSVFQKKLPQNHVTAGDEEEDDAFELLFKQLEEDLKNDGLSKDDSDDEITEEEVAMLERELEEEALGDYDPEVLDLDTSKTQASNKDPETGGNVAVEDNSLKLRTWQLKKLATALKIGRRKTNVSVFLLMYFHPSLFVRLLQDFLYFVFNFSLYVFDKIHILLLHPLPK